MLYVAAQGSDIVPLTSSAVTYPSCGPSMPRLRYASRQHHRAVIEARRRLVDLLTKIGELTSILCRRRGLSLSNSTDVMG